MSYTAKAPLALHNLFIIQQQNTYSVVIILFGHVYMYIFVPFAVSLFRDALLSRRAVYLIYQQKTTYHYPLHPNNNEILLLLVREKKTNEISVVFIFFYVFGLGRSAQIDDKHINKVLLL